jgi:hypothetical protein
LGDFNILNGYKNVVKSVGMIETVFIEPVVSLAYP